MPITLHIYDDDAVDDFDSFSMMPSDILILVY